MKAGKLIISLSLLLGVNHTHALPMVAAFMSLPSATVNSFCNGLSERSKDPKFTDTIEGDYCDKNVPIGTFQRDLIINKCTTLITNRLKNNSYDVKGNCLSELGKVSEIKNSLAAVASEKVMTSGQSAFGMEVDIPFGLSNPMYQCMYKPASVDYRCDPETFPTIMQEFEEISANVPSNTQGVATTLDTNYTSNECKCLKKKISTLYPENRGQFKARIKTEEDKINKKLQQKLGKKIINDYAKILEDVNYYQTNNPQVLSHSASSGVYQCLNENNIEKSVAENCRNKNIDPHMQEKNISSLFSAFGESGDNPDLAKKIKSLKKDVLKDGAKVTRDQYDTVRAGLIASNPQFTFLDEVFQLAFKNPELVELMESDLRLVKSQPGVTLNERIRWDKNFPKMIEEIVKKNQSPLLDESHKRYYKNLEIALKDPDILRSIYADAMKAAIGHPGYKAIFFNKELFAKYKSELGQKPLQSLMNETNHLANHYLKECEKMVELLAEAACTPTSELMAKTPIDEINRIVVDEGIDLALKDQLLCEKDVKKDDLSIFKDLAVDKKNVVHQSDYFISKQNSKADAKTGYDNFVQASKGNDNIAQVIRQAATIGEKQRENFNIPKFFSDSANVQKKAEALPLGTPVIAPKGSTSSVVESLHDQPHFDPKIQQAMAQANFNSFAPIQDSQYAAPATTETRKSQENLLREFLADEKNKSEVNKLLSNTSDEDLEMLMKLKEEIAKDQNRLQQLIKENEKLKLNAMENDLQKIEKEIKKAEPKVANLPERREYSPSSFFQGGSQSGAMTSQAQFHHDSSSATSDSSSLGKATASGSSKNSNAASVGRQVASIPSSDITTSSGSSSRSGAIIIESSTVRNGEMAKEDLSKEVISYVTQTNLDLSALKKLKEDGLVLKFKVLKDGVEVQEEVAVNYAELSPEARSLLENRIAKEEKNINYERLKRDYSLATLKMILGAKAQEKFVN